METRIEGVFIVSVQGKVKLFFQHLLAKESSTVCDVRYSLNFPFFGIACLFTLS